MGYPRFGMHYHFLLAWTCLFSIQYHIPKLSEECHTSHCFRIRSKLYDSIHTIMFSCRKDDNHRHFSIIVHTLVLHLSL